MLEMICKQLGIEVGVAWNGNDYDKYQVDKYGDLSTKHSSGGVWIIYNEGWPSLLTGKLKPVWQPKYDEMYYIPDISWENEGGRCSEVIWLNDSIDQYRFKNNLVFRTKEEAIEAANQMLQLWKGR